MSNVELSREQRDIVEAPYEAICVKASAGSGKTRILTERIRFFLKDTQKRVLALTFTNRAGEEIKERLSSVDDIKNRAVIGTFHSFCQSIIESRGNLIGYNEMPHIFESQDDRLELIGEAIEKIPGLKENYSGLSHEKQNKIKLNALDFISRVKRECINKDELYLQVKDENSRLLYDIYSDILKDQNAIDFDDLILLANRILNDNPRVANLYRRGFIGICIDESQDLNKAQYRFLRTLTNGEFKNITMVGDPNQSIFAFNGSSSEFMKTNFVEDYSAKVFELNKNYRSSKAVLENASKVIETKVDTSNVVKEGIFNLKSLRNEEEEAKWVANKIKELLKEESHKEVEGMIIPERIAIIARNRYLFKNLEEELIKKEIKYGYKVSLGAPKFESKLMKVFILALTLRLNSYDLIHREKLMELLELDSEYTKLEDVKKEAKKNCEKVIIQTVLDLQDNGTNFKNSLDTIKDIIKDLDEEERNMLYNDIDDLKNHWSTYAKKTDSKSLLKFKIDMSLGKTNPLVNHKGVTLSSVHTMKGQEFDIVFILGADDGTFPDYRAIKNQGIELKQEKNNLYVAFTRAKRILYVTYPKERTMPWGDKLKRKKSRFLENIN